MLDADSGASLQRVVVDDDADAIFLSPSIANGAVYVGTYDFNQSTPADYDMRDDVLRIFAMSPALRLVSTGIYPLSTSLKLESQQGKEHLMPRSERTLQVWFTGAGNKWEETRETYGNAP